MKPSLFVIIQQKKFSKKNASDVIFLLDKGFCEKFDFPDDI